MAILNEVKDKIKALPVFEKRQDRDDYIEIVFYNRDIEKWNIVLNGFLGQAIKPAGAKADKDLQNSVKEYGGINDNQTLFKKDFNNECVLAMYWPWQNDKHTTLKIILQKRGET
jgi:hypothetical protein